MKQILFINACLRRESRTLVVAEDLLRGTEGEITRVDLEQEGIRPLTGESLKKREALLRERRMDDPMLRYARQFAEADEIFVAAPFWDLSFPAALKSYFEQITVAGITFTYDQGRPVGLCRAKRLVYVTTSGGRIVDDFGYAYVKALAKQFYGIPDTLCYRGENLDVLEVTADRVLKEIPITVFE